MLDKNKQLHTSVNWAITIEIKMHMIEGVKQLHNKKKKECGRRLQVWFEQCQLRFMFLVKNISLKIVPQQNLVLWYNNYRIFWLFSDRCAVFFLFLVPSGRERASFLWGGEGSRAKSFSID